MSVSKKRQLRKRKSSEDFNESSSSDYSDVSLDAAENMEESETPVTKMVNKIIGDKKMKVESEVKSGSTNNLSSVNKLNLKVKE